MEGYLLRLDRCRRTAGPHRTAQGYRRFRCRDCGKQVNERSAGLLNRARYPTDVIALVVLWQLRNRLTLRDLSEMFLQRRVVFSYEAVRAGRRNSRRSWPANFGSGAGARAVPAVANGMWTRPT